VRPRTAFLALVLAALPVNAAFADQAKSFGAWDVHYIVIPSTFLRPHIATQYDVVRAKNRSLINISVLDKTGQAARGTVTGWASNLLGQQTNLAFREVAEAGAVYYLAEIEHENEDILRFHITATVDGSPKMLVEFQQKLYWEDADASGAR